ncbi:MAG: glycosyltransferase family 4 protein [Bacteroidales bacterium]|nr:glycosyltransferase family 4 protein [Bacteroidales bacterium]
MKSILLITPLYPIPYPENNATDVCHSFAKEWVKLGYDVLVIHLQPVHCAAWHLLIRFFGKQIANMVGGGNFYAKRLRRTENYVMDGVRVYRIPVYNFIPHGRFPSGSVDSFVSGTLAILEELKFRPDVITGHMMPLEIIPLLNRHIGARTCTVEHGVPKKVRKRYPDYEALVKSYDRFGFRSRDIQARYEKEVCPVPKPFICYSGIPAYYLDAPAERDFSKPVKNFIFVGEFIRRKYPSVIVPALCKAFPDRDFSLTFVGEGPEKENIEREIEVWDVKDKVVFTGKVPRGEIKASYDAADCMIMISSGEAFGLVYVEAMARGCITVASRGEGMDGVIIDGDNGFLCGAGSVDGLADLISRIRALSPAEREAVSRNARKTASSMTDREVARAYAEELFRND